MADMQEDAGEEGDYFNDQMGLRKAKLREQTRVSRDIRGRFKTLFELIFKIFDGFDEKVPMGC